MTTSQNGPIISVEDFIENRGMKSLIESQASTETSIIGNNQSSKKNNPKVRKKIYVRINQPKK